MQISNSSLSALQTHFLHNETTTFFSLLKQNNLTFEDKRGVVVNKALQVVRGMWK